MADVARDIQRWAKRIRDTARKNDDSEQWRLEKIEKFANEILELCELLAANKGIKK